MATTFITLVNDTLRRLNEVELTATDFSTASGFRAQVKDAINSSIQEISQKEFEFPFNFTAGSLTLVVGQQEYSLPSDFKAYDTLDEATVLGWVKTAIGTDEVTAIEKALEDNIAIINTPVTATGKPF